VHPKGHTLNSKVTAVVVSLRPYQWIKNTLIFAALIFSGNLGNIGALQTSILAFLAFCMASSAIYLLNDIRDIKEDQLHPEKRHRPIAAGLISRTTATVMSIGLMVVSMWMALQMMNRWFDILLTVYLLMHISYSFGLKKIVILDIMIVAAGFVLRAISGAVVINVSASPWLVICTLMLALFVVLGKRRNELATLNRDARQHRISLSDYSEHLIDQMMSIVGAGAIVTYALYTVSAETVQRIGSNFLMLTTPFVIFGLFRYLYLVQQQKGGGDPTKIFWNDLQTIINVILWVSCAALIIYAPEWANWFDLN